MSATKPTEEPKELTKQEIGYHSALADVTLQRYNLARAADAPAAEVKWQYGATATFIVVAGYSRLNMSAYNGPGQPVTVKFDYVGQGGASGLLGGGATWGTFWCFIDHDQLAGEAAYSVEVTTVHTSAQFFRNGQLIGHYVGGGINLITLLAGGGTGTFTI